MIGRKSGLIGLIAYQRQVREGAEIIRRDELAAGQLAAACQYLGIELGM